MEPDTVMTVRCPKCPYCGERAQLVVRVTSLMAWKRGALVQEAFPDMSADDREMLMTGTHARCWDAIFGEA